MEYEDAVFQYIDTLLYLGILAFPTALRTPPSLLYVFDRLRPPLSAAAFCISRNFRRSLPVYYHSERFSPHSLNHTPSAMEISAKFEHPLEKASGATPAMTIDQISAGEMTRNRLGMRGKKDGAPSRSLARA